MTIQSMTGFARSQGSRGSVAWHWEVRSVNGRGLDVRLRVPPGYDSLEPKVREVAARHFVRGSLNVSLQVRSEGAPTQIRLNEAALQQVLAAAAIVGSALEGAPRPSVEGILGVRGVLETVEAAEDEAEQAARTAAMLETLDAALLGLVAARQAEGARLAEVLSAQVGEVERLTAAVAASPVRSAEAIRARLREQVARLMDASAGQFDADRLHQEAVLLATRADVEEELKRLGAHVAAARELIGASEPVGRKLDFLAQEFNREANTLCSKANDTDVTRLGLALKTVIDQMREQVQNIE